MLGLEIREGALINMLDKLRARTARSTMRPSNDISMKTHDQLRMRLNDFVTASLSGQAPQVA